MILSEVKSYPNVICSECGEKYGKRECGIATWSKDRCDICGTYTECTEPRDFGHLKPTWKTHNG